MITVSKLKDACEKIEREFGSDCPVCIQIYKNDCGKIFGDYCMGVYRNAAGALFLTNCAFKHGDCW